MLRIVERGSTFLLPPLFPFSNFFSFSFFFFFPPLQSVQRRKLKRFVVIFYRGRGYFNRNGRRSCVTYGNLSSLQLPSVCARAGRLLASNGGLLKSAKNMKMFGQLEERRRFVNVSANVPFDMVHLEKERFDRALKIYFQMKRNRCSQSSVPKLDSKHE